MWKWNHEKVVESIKRRQESRKRQTNKNKTNQKQVKCKYNPRHIINYCCRLNCVPPKYTVKS